MKEIKIKPALFVVDVQNCFMSPGGSYDKMKFDIAPYRKIIDPLKEAVKRARALGIPIFFSKAVREASGVDTLDRVHKILPSTRRERILKVPLCIRGSWDAELIEGVGADPKKDYIVEKRRDSAFRGTELEVYLKALGIDILVFAGVDTSICVESTLRDAFNTGYDIILLSDATASHSPRFYESTLEEIKENFGLVMTSDDFFSQINKENESFLFKL